MNKTEKQEFFLLAVVPAMAGLLTFLALLVAEALRAGSGG